MRQLISTLVLLVFPPLAATQDSAQFSRLEQEVRQLQREVLVLSQLVNQLRTRPERSAAPALPLPVVPPAGGSRATPVPDAAAVEARWVNADRWKKLRAGMTELEVMAELGPPTSMRGDERERVLLYALEIGASGFLAGSITLRDRLVATVETPTLQ